MKKKLIVIILIVILILVVGIYFYVYLGKQSRHVTSGSTSTQATAAPSSTQNIHIPVDIFSGDRTGSHQEPITNTSTGETVTFGSNQGNQTMNEGWIVYLNKKKIGVLTGQSTNLFSFSPNNQRLAFRVNYQINGNNLGYNLVIINVASGTISGIGSQPEGAFIESYSWEGNDALNIVSYPVSFSYSGNGIVTYYRIAPKQVWHYDLTTGSSTIVSETP
jgi:hypothetical protein